MLELKCYLCYDFKIHCFIKIRCKVYQDIKYLLLHIIIQKLVLFLITNKYIFVLVPINLTYSQYIIYLINIIHNLTQYI